MQADPSSLSPRPLRHHGLVGRTFIVTFIVALINDSYRKVSFRFPSSDIHLGATQISFFFKNFGLYWNSLADMKGGLFF